jgi:hypothetical protein
MSRQNRQRTDDNTSSGQGAFGMGGDPSDDPRDQYSGGDSREERGFTDELDIVDPDELDANYFEEDEDED